MKDKQQVSKETRKMIRDLNQKIAELHDLPPECLKNSGEEIIKPAILFIDEMKPLEPEIAGVLAYCIGCRDLLKDGTPAYNDYTSMIADLEYLQKILFES